MRLTKRDENKVWFAHGRPRGLFCPVEYCKNASRCENAKHRTCPYLQLLDKLAAYEDTGLEPEEIKNLNNGIIPDHWAELFKAECEGRLIVLPCKVGDVVYRIHTKDHVEKHCVLAFHVCKTLDGPLSASGLWFWDETGRETPVKTIGKTVFLTRAEAEATLKGEGKDV